MQDARSLLELIFVILIVGIVAGIFSMFLIMNLKEARGVALENQLTNLKYSLELYMILEGQHPKDLRELNKRCTALKDDNLYGRKYLELQAQDKEGYPVDPYGRRFIYDSSTGKIERGRSR